MTPEKEEALIAKYPSIFRDCNGEDETVTCMAAGLCVGDGWCDLIDELCAEIMKLEDIPDFKASQVKEKFGGLRFYTSGGDDKSYKLVCAAETFSFCVCEACGSKENVTTSGGWLATRCHACRNPPRDSK